MKLDFNKEINGLDGAPMLGTNLGKSIASAMASQTKGDALKFWDWSLKMFNGTPIDLDVSDQGTLKEFIKNSDQLSVAVKAQALEVFEKTKETEK